MLTETDTVTDISTSVVYAETTFSLRRYNDDVSAQHFSLSRFLHSYNLGALTNSTRQNHNSTCGDYDIL